MKMLKTATATAIVIFSAYGALAESRPPVPRVHPYFAEMWEWDTVLEEGFERLNRGRAIPQRGCSTAYDLVRGQGAWERDTRAFALRWQGSGRPTVICFGQQEVGETQ